MRSVINHLTVKNLSCVRQQHHLFHHLSFELTNGTLLLIEGNNGSGKSSLLRMLAGLFTPSDGEIKWCGESIHTLQNLYTAKLHYVGHTNGIKLGLSVRENIKLAQCLNITKVLPEKTDDVLTSLQLNAQQNTLAKYLSAGQKRRLSFVKLFLFPKPLWILDEPLTALDHTTQNLFLAELEKHCGMGGIAIISSHHSLSLQQKKAMQTLRLASC